MTDGCSNGRMERCGSIGAGLGVDESFFKLGLEPNTFDAAALHAPDGLAVNERFGGDWGKSGCVYLAGG